MWKYCGSIFHLGFFIFYIIFLSFISFSSIHVSFPFFFFLFFSATQVSSVHSYLYPPFFYFLFHLKNIPATTFTSHQRERERERLMLVRRPTAGGNRGCQKDKAGGDRRSPCSTTTSTAPPPLVLLPTTKLVQIGLFFFSFFLFSYLLVLIQLYFKNWILFCVLCLDYVRNGENERKKEILRREKELINSSWYNFLSRKFDLELLQCSLD